MSKIKTLIELFDKNQVENVIAGLRLLPETIIFVGFKDVMTNKRISDLKKFFEMKNLNIKLKFIYVERYNYMNILDEFSHVINKYDDCCFDLTGGKELILAAMGEVSLKYDVPMVQFNVRTGKFIKIKNCESIEDIKKAKMSIVECVTLNGGAVVYDTEFDYDWNLNDEFKKDIEKIWNICKKDCVLWNKQSKILGKIESKAYLNLENESLDSGFLEELKRNKLIRKFDFENKVINVEYKNEQVKRCILKAGNILELYIYMIVYEINEENNRCYADADIGVTVDWDGVVGHNKRHLQAETRNEVDVMLVKDLIPIFISCKNGTVHKEALYELFTVAEKFGGKYSRKILITSSDIKKDASFDYIIKRAYDMNIRIIYGIDDMDKEEIKEKLKIYAK